MATELSANNPDLIESIRRNMGNRPQPNEDNNSTPDGNSDGSRSIFNLNHQKKNKQKFIFIFLFFF